MATLYVGVRNAPFVALAARSALRPRPPGHDQISLVKRVAARANARCNSRAFRA